MEYIKVCGLKEIKHVELCIDNEVNAIGFIYNVPSSPRNLEKSELMNILKEIPKKILTVVVFKPQNILELENIMNEIDVDLYQIQPSLHHSR